MGFVMALLGFAANAGAQSFPQLSKFCPDGTAGGQCARASGLAISPSNGHIFEVDTRNNRVQEFTPWGDFVKAFGWSVVASGPGDKPRNEIQQLTVTATGGSFKLRYAQPGSFNVGETAPIAAETAPIAFQPGVAPTAAQVESALVNATSSNPDSFAPGDLNVSGPAGGPWTIEFVGQYADTDFGGGIFVLEGVKEWFHPVTKVKEGGLTGAGAAATLITTQPGGNYEICIPADGDVCRDGSPGTNPGQFGGHPNSEIGAQGVAIDSSGDVYVLDRRNHRVQKYDPDGNFLLMFGGSVNQTTGEDVCTAAQLEGGDVCGAGTVGDPGPGEGEFGRWQVNGLPNLGDYLAVGPDDTVYVGDTDRIQRFDTSGVFQGQLAGAVAGETVQSLAVGPTGAIYAAFTDPATIYNDNKSSKPNVRVLDGGGNEIGQLPVPNPRGIATDAEGNVFVIASGPARTSTVLGFTAAGAPIDLDPDSASNAIGEGVLQESTGIAAASPPTCGLTGTNLAVSSFLERIVNSIHLFGGAPDPSICPQPIAAPTIGSQFATAVDTASATLKARINPRFWPDTRYRVEYGTGKCSEGGCTLSQPASPGALLTPGVLNVEVLTGAVILTGLKPGTTYHYRFLAESGGGSATAEEKTFRTADAPASEAGCPNDVFRTGPSAALPDCRAYELVSPLDKASGGDIARAGGLSLVQADPSGQRMSFSSARSFAAPEGGPLVAQYLGSRGSGGWSSASISPPRSSLSLYALGGSEANYFKALSPDLCSGWVLQDSALALTADAPAGVPNLYRRDNCGGGAYQLLSSTLPPGFGPTPYSSLYFPTVQGFSEDASRTVFRANSPLAVAPGGPRPPFLCSVISKTPGTFAYRWLRDGAPIGGATNPTYTPVSADVGKTLQCQVTTTASGRTSLVASEALPVVPLPATEPPNPGFKTPGSADLPGTPAIAGAPVVGSTLTCAPGPWNNTPTFAYQWLRDGNAIAGATSATYLPVPADEGTSIQCRATGTNAGGAALSFSRAVTVEASLPLATAPPTLAGTPEAGQTLTCEKGTWSSSSSFAYQWLRNGDAIGAATSSEYTLTAAEEGKAVQCQVSGANSEGTVAAASSRLVVAPAPGTAPPSRLTAGTIDGTPEAGQTLTCEKGTWTGSPTFAYQWLRDGAAIGAATSSEYTLTAADAGKALQCRIAATNAGGTVVALDGDEDSALYAAPPAAPRTVITTIGNQQLYLNSGSTLRLVSVLPNGTATAAISATTGTGWAFSLGPNSRDDAVQRAVSADGSRVFWTATTHLAFDTSGTGAGTLYLRLNAAEPQSAISGGKCTEAAKACTIPVSGSPEARFISANPQGSRVVYLAGASNPNVGLQLYIGALDVSGSEPVVDSELIASGVRGVVGVSEDAKRIYFVSREALSGDQNSEGDEALAGQPNLYFYEEGSPLEFVATISAIDASYGEIRPNAGTPPTPVSLSPSRRNSRVTPDGLHVAFTATAAPTGYDNTDAISGAANAEVFLYDATANGGEGRLLCASCNPSGARPAGRLINSGFVGGEDDLWAAAMIPGWSSQFQPTRALSDNGKRVFFDAYAPLLPGDTNGRADVYQWEAPGEGSCSEASSSFSEQNGGCLRLITSGQSSEDSEFMDATPSGSDVFFLTQASLVPDDYGLRDVYDARVNGGFAPRQAPGQGCQGDACQSPPAPPASDTPSSATFNGQGNVKETSPRPRCPKGRSKARRGGKTVCVNNRKPKKPKKQTKKSSKKRAGKAEKGGAR
ncbi:MAG TPA: hypothetical protein VFY48_09665 [Solirubrobacterales bacterium]|nr:hypothetical protein [Solirubrobacterales bacterium]